MAQPAFPEHAHSLTGGCHCRAIRYTISIPALAERPIAVPAATNPGDRTADRRWPVVELDHCVDCRTTAGVPVNAWVFLPAAWVAFALEDAGTGEVFRAAALEVITKPPPEGVQGRATWYRHYNAVDGMRTRGFCGRCGTHLTFASEVRLKEAVPRMDVTLGSFDETEDGRAYGGLRPDWNVWWEQAVPWVKGMVMGEGGAEGVGKWRSPRGDRTLIL